MSLYFAIYLLCSKNYSSSERTLRLRPLSKKDFSIKIQLFLTFKENNNKVRKPKETAHGNYILYIILVV